MGNIFDICRGRGVKPEFRPITPNHVVDESIPSKSKAHPNHGYSNNFIKTTRYTLLTFLPKNLFEQFHRFANIYFIFVVALNWIPQVNAFAKEVAVIPVIFVLLVTALKDAYEDFRRYRSDKKVNSSTCRIYDKHKNHYVKTQWAHVRAGDFVHLGSNEIIPADILFLRSSDAQGVCHIETSNLDGESNLKQRSIVEEFASVAQREDFKPSSFTYKVDVEQPNAEIYGFKGRIIMEGDKQASLNNSNMLLRGCMIRNTDYIEGLVVYAGLETKAMMNNRGPRYKISRLESKINRDVIWCVILLLFMCFFCAIGSGIWLADYNNLTDNTNLVPFIAFGNLDEYSPLYQGFIVFWTYIIIFQSVIPLPMYVSLELVKLGQLYFIVSDIEMYCEESDKPVEVRALNITEDLGQIEYIFSDKTGTLTENKMEFKSCTIGGVNYPHMPLGEDDDSHSDYNSRASFTALSRASSTMENLYLEPTIQRELANMSLRNLESVELTMPPHVKRVQEFFFLMAVCNTVVVSYIHEDAMDESGYVMDDHVPQSNGKGNSTFGSKGSLDKTGSQTKLNNIGSSLKSRSLLSLSASESGGDYMSEGSVAGSSFISDGSMVMHYEAESPDELSLVKAASTYGCKLKGRSPGKCRVFLPGEQEEVEFDVLNVLAFDATRKRMSVIVRQIKSRKIVLYIKGADSCIFEILHPRYEVDDDERRIKAMTQEHLDSYAMKGLRTLCMGKRELDIATYEKWAVKFKAAEASMNNRDELVMEACLEIEMDIELLGATGIEDKLQEGVPSAIYNLREAGMKVWVLTGDKQETATQIAYSCHLYSSDQRLFEITVESMEDAKARMDDILYEMRTVRSEEESRSTWGSRPSLFSNSMASLRSEPDVMKRFALIINGPSLVFATSESLKKRFLKICLQCQSVVCCRATPIQKATIVRLVRDNLNKLTLAIGDGANDVSMIQTADVGVGISGQEGMQAVMSSDFAIARFRFLERLLLVHGHWCQDRLAKFAAIMFYKSLLSTLVMFWFQLFSGFSGSLMIDSLYLMMQHVLFTAIPPLTIGIFDKDLSAKTLLADPGLYKPGMRGEMYTHWTYLIVLIDSLWQSAAIYFVPHLSYDNHAVGLWEFGTTIDVCMILTCLLHFCIEINTWVWIQWAAIVFSFFVFWAFLLVSNAIFFTFNHPSNSYWVMENTISTAIHTAIVIITCFVALLPRLLVRSIQITVFPDEIGIAKRKEKLLEMELSQEDRRDEGSQESQEGGLAGPYTNGGPVYSTPNDGGMYTQQESMPPPGRYRKNHELPRDKGEVNRGFSTSGDFDSQGDLGVPMASTPIQGTPMDHITRQRSRSGNDGVQSVKL